jgi:hypothetical protein
MDRHQLFAVFRVIELNTMFINQSPQTRQQKEG